MTVKTYYNSKSGNARLSRNFTVKEFVCKDGTDKVLIDTDLIVVLQKIRDHFGRSVVITSGYRTAEYNKKIGGSAGSYHVKGQAVDIQVTDVNAVIVGIYAQSLSVGGLGVYAYARGGWCHIDTRLKPYRWLQIDKTGSESVDKIMPLLKKLNSNNPKLAVMLVQRQFGLTQPGIFNDILFTKVCNFQKTNGLIVDGIIGKNTWTFLFRK